MNTIDKILIACAIAVIVFTITMIVIFCIYQDIPSTLVECFYNLAGSEAFITFGIWWIKKKANRKDKDNDREIKEP